jgi:hypothetical protein
VLFFKKYKTAPEFISNFKLGEPEIDSFKKYLITKKITNIFFTGKEKGFNQILKALIGRNLFDKDAYYPILNENDTAILKAVEVLNKK